MVKTSSMKVLRHLGQDWLEMVDATMGEEPFFYNSRTKQISLEPPVALPFSRVAQGQPPKVVRELHGGWLECEDFRGRFFYNMASKVTTQELPQEVSEGQVSAASGAEMPVPPKVLRTLGGSWLELDKDGEVFYFNSETGLVSVSLPPEARMDEPTLLASSPPLGSGMSSSIVERVLADVRETLKESALDEAASLNTSYESRPAQAPLAPSHVDRQSHEQEQKPPQPCQQQEPEASIKLKLGEYVVCEDSSGEFYVHLPSGEEFEEPPEELLLLVMQMKAQEQQQMSVAREMPPGAARSPKSPKFARPPSSLQQSMSTSPVKSKPPSSKKARPKASTRSGYPIP
eukprot:gnl/MRDRNA2_/MRDRNA2_108994_c0_seq1.p1 gnl/MRDRNA2_/MRDRNA2_108994_c0~~gnl/MRDRNA2_/MRDRNA2_108994_c0_seq1.p1  ORF type:complete len:344 (+),score=71.06 gnl/MRDRNA2_/MRDRNA2_108994_c0_seq1:82-1113(+)